MGGSGQTCLTNDPNQRPLFALFDGTFNTVLFTGLGIWISGPLTAKYGGLGNPGVFYDMQLYLGIASFALVCFAIFSLAPKDNSKYFGTGQAQKVGLKNYADVLMYNRAIQILVLSASTDKLGMQARTSTATCAANSYRRFLFPPLDQRYYLFGNMLDWYQLWYDIH